MRLLPRENHHFLTSSNMLVIGVKKYSASEQFGGVQNCVFFLGKSHFLYTFTAFDFKTRQFFCGSEQFGGLQKQKCVFLLGTKPLRFSAFRWCTEVRLLASGKFCHMHSSNIFPHQNTNCIQLPFSHNCWYGFVFFLW